LNISIMISVRGGEGRVIGSSNGEDRGKGGNGSRREE
jgi:hypothetical protein